MDKTYRAYKHIKSGCIWVPFYKVVKVEGSTVEAVEIITDGVVDAEIKKEMKNDFVVAEITKEQFVSCTKNIKMEICAASGIGCIREKFGCLFTCTAYYQLSDEYVKGHDLVYETRIIENSPIYEYGPLSYALNI